MLKLTQLLLCAGIIFANISANADSEKAQSIVLDNGLTVAVREIPASSLIALQMWVRGGLLAEGEYLGSGISHFIEHMLFKGTERRQPGDIAEEIHSLGGELNAATSLDYTYYKITLPSEHLGKAMEVMADAIRNSTFSEEELEKEKEVILKEINMGEDDPARKSWNMLFREAFITHPYREPVIGRRDFFETLTRKDLLWFYKTRYTPQNMVLAVAGGVDSDYVLNEARNYFGGWKGASNFILPSFSEPAQLSFRRYTGHFPGEKAYMRIGYHIPGLGDEALYAMDLLASILGKGASSRLYREIKERKGLADTISAFSYTPSGEGIFGIEAVTGADKLTLLEDGILKEIDEIKRKGVLEEELLKAKRIIRSEYQLSMERVEIVASDIGYNKLVLGDENFGSHYIEKAMQVKKEDIREAAKRFLREENLSVCVLSPEAGAKKEKMLKKAERAIHKYEVPKTLVVLASESSVSPMVSLNILFNGGVIYEERDKNGIFSLLAKCLIRSTKKKEYLALHSEIESRGAGLSSYSGYNSFGLSLTLAKGDIGWGIDILSSLLREPLFKEEDIKKAKEELEAELKMEEDDVLRKAFYLFRETIFGAHPYGWRDRGTPQTLTNITRGDIISTYQKFCLGQTPVLAIFGDIEESAVLPIIEKKFMFLSEKDISPELGRLPLPPDAPSRRELALPREQAILVFGFPGVSIRDEDRFPIDVIANVLSGQSGRLFTAIREKRGDAYYVGAFQISGLAPGAIVFYAGTTSEKIEEVKEIMEKEIYGLREEFIPGEELKKAKENLIGMRRISIEPNSGFAFDAGLNELYGLGFNFYLDYEKNIRGVDKTKIKEVAEKYFKPEKLSWLIINPKI